MSTIGQRPFGIRMDTIGLSATVNDALDSPVVGPFEMERSSLKDNYFSLKCSKITLEIR